MYRAANECFSGESSKHSTQSHASSHCTHTPRYRLCLAAALGMSNALPATSLPCEECARKVDFTEARWRTSSAASSQGGASTRAPTAYTEEDRISWASSSFGRNSGSSSSGLALMRTSSSATNEYAGGSTQYPCSGDFFCPTPSKRFNSSFDALRQKPDVLSLTGSNSSPSCVQDTWPRSRAPHISPTYLSTHSSSLFALAVSHAASFVYEE